MPSDPLPPGWDAAQGRRVYTIAMGHVCQKQHQ